MRILLLNLYYPPDPAPTGKYLHDLAKALTKEGHDVSVLCSRGAYSGQGQYQSKEILDGVSVQRLSAFSYGRKNLAGRVADYGSFYALLTAKLLTVRPCPDITLALTTPPFIGFLAKEIATLRGFHHAHWIMDQYPDAIVAHGLLRPGNPFLRILCAVTRESFHGASLILTLGPHMLGLVRRYADPSREPNLKAMSLWCDDALTPWEDSQLIPIRVERGWDSSDTVLMYSGNMGLGHRFSEFLEAARILGRTGPLWAFCGDGKRRQEIEHFISHERQARCELHLNAPIQRLREHLCSADVHLVSLDERWQGTIVPSKVQGIFAVGRPVLFVGGSKNEIADWIVASGGGWVVAQDNIPSLLQAVNEARDPNERTLRGERALAFARQHFSREHNCSQIAAWIEAACNPLV